MLGREIEATFKNAKEIKMGMMHPTKKGVKPKKIYHF
jgi:hypothetical protein